MPVALDLVRLLYLVYEYIVRVAIVNNPRLDIRAEVSRILKLFKFIHVKGDGNDMIVFNANIS